MATRGVVVSWSGGKDCAMALHEFRLDESYEGLRLEALLTTLTDGYDRVSGHGVHRDLVEQQADRIGLPLQKAYIPTRGDMTDYDRVMSAAYRDRQAHGIVGVVYGDIFLKGPKKAHLAALERLDMVGVFPLWHRPSMASVRRFIALGFEAIVVCVDAAVLDVSFVGRTVDEALLKDLPRGVDPAGENGEYHTFATYGPDWSGRVEYEVVGTITRNGQHFCDVRAK
jgi:uncharacterized protein (TIGR00290 family)